MKFKTPSTRVLPQVPSASAGEEDKTRFYNEVVNALDDYVRRIREDLLKISSGTGVLEHGLLSGLTDDDHTQYHTNARGDLRYAPVANGVTNGNSHDHSGGDGAQIDHTTLSNIGTNVHSVIDSFIGSKAAASGLASLDASSTVVQNPANATTTPTASKIPIADGTGKIDSGWIPPLGTSYFKETQCVISNAADTANDITFGVCSVLDSTGAYMMALASAMTKRSDADYASGDGNGGGTLSGSGWFHCYVIRKDSDGSIDCCFNTVPAGHTYYRHVGWIYHTDAAGITKFIQKDKYFYLDVMSADYAGTNPGTSAITVTAKVPPSTIGIFTVYGYNSDATVCYVWTTPISATDTTPAAGCQLFRVNSTVSIVTFGPIYIPVDASSQIRTRISYSAGNVAHVIRTLGWIDVLL